MNHEDYSVYPKVHIHSESRRAFLLSFSLPGLMQLCTDRCFAQLQMWWGVLAVLSWQSRKSQSWCCRCVTGAADHLSAAWAACALWDAPCKARHPPGQLRWAHPRLLQCCGKHSHVKSQIWNILTCEFNLTPHLQRASLAIFWPVESLLKKLKTHS